MIVQLDCNPIELLLTTDVVVIAPDYDQYRVTFPFRKVGEHAVSSTADEFNKELSILLKKLCTPGSTFIFVVNHRGALSLDERWQIRRPKRVSSVQEAVPALPPPLVQIVVDYAEEKGVAPCALLWYASSISAIVIRCAVAGYLTKPE